MASLAGSTLRSVFVTGLQNAHAVENQALAMIDRQLDRLVRYPEISERLRSHRGETEVQIRRLDEILATFNARNSSMKDFALSFMGNMAALGTVMAADEVLKDQMVNYAFENFEVASYRSLIALSEAGDFADATGLLRETLREEEAMAAWVLDSLPGLTLKYVGLRNSGASADR
ncbi:MAG TPA: ferritin-like domain-containing protein [Sphingomicrobium sp.]|nr:ferritin-like domain-containing protein [Sphingomicrobium sp.]